MPDTRRRIAKDRNQMASPSELIAHVKDADVVHLPFGREFVVPQIFERIGLPLHMTKFMLAEVVVALLMIAIFVPLAQSHR